MRPERGAMLVLAAASLLVPGCRRTPVRAPRVTRSTAPAPLTLPQGGVRGIYLTGWTAGTRSHFNNLLGLVARTNLNAMVIDVKDDGQVSYDTNVALAREVGASRHMFRVDAVLARLRRAGIFPIARIACMRDSVVARKHPEMAVHDAHGRVWYDRSHHAWLNPYSRAVWDYNVDIALDAVRHGFREVQFDYVRFPSEGKVSSLTYPGKPPHSLREDQIAAFLKYASQKVHGAGAWFTADVFGLTSLVANDEGIGQKFRKVIEDVDYLCPMVYPSHYAYGEYGLKDPNTQPYRIITLSVGDAIRRMKGSRCRLRPWIQDFSLRGVHYGPSEVRAQIRALHDLGVNEYLLWNASNRYTEAALDRKPPGGHS